MRGPACRESPVGSARGAQSSFTGQPPTVTYSGIYTCYGIDTGDTALVADADVLGDDLDQLSHLSETNGQAPTFGAIDRAAHRRTVRAAISEDVQDLLRNTGARVSARIHLTLEILWNEVHGDATRGAEVAAVLKLTEAPGFNAIYRSVGVGVCNQVGDRRGPLIVHGDEIFGSRRLIRRCGGVGCWWYLISSTTCEKGCAGEERERDPGEAVQSVQFNLR